jgi:hypothetical protein
MRQYSLSTIPTETSLDTLATCGRIVSVLLHGTFRIIDYDFLLLNSQICGDKGTSYFAAVGAVAKMSPLLREQLVVVDGYSNATA